ncbi:ribbon-helix-helix domain-containing protein [Candidatus Bipolaricaulota bacterium]|nr:ribbon-helix-helix domain-containing protein [Candidatus Bipolaricaulota bacterium]
MPRVAKGERKHLDKISIYIPQDKAAKYDVMPRLRKLAEKKDRSINYLVVQAIVQYLDREERKEAKK